MLLDGLTKHYDYVLHNNGRRELLCSFRYIEKKTIRWQRRIERIKNLDGEMDVLNCYVQPNTLKRKPFGEKEELKELKI